MTPGAPPNPVLAMTGISKRFPGVLALDNVDFDARPGEVHALMGENGAGKSTLIKILTGALRRDAGSIALAGEPFEPASPADSQRRGVSAVYQEIGLIPTLSIAENLLVGRPGAVPRGWFGIRRGAMRRRAADILARLGLRLDPDDLLGRHSIAVQQMVAIARAVDADARLLILDEPTSSLDRRETDVLFDLVRRLRDRGLAIVFITHFLDQVYRVSDRITILRNGRKAGTFDAPSFPRLDLVGHMLGRSPAEASALGTARPASKPPADARAVASARGLGRRGGIEPFDLDIRGGEVVGLAGLLGSGRTEAARLLFAADKRDSGTLSIGGRSPHTPRAAVAAGVAFCPEDRKAEGLFDAMSIRDNIAIVAQRSLGGLLSRRRHARIARGMIERLGIATPDDARPAGQLSGGNQQKVILARWLVANPRLLILDEPTRGIDVGAKSQLEALIDSLAASGLAILFISSELEEVVRRSHRVRVLRDRRMVGELAGNEITEPAVMAAIAAPGAP